MAKVNKLKQFRHITQLFIAFYDILATKWGWRHALLFFPVTWLYASEVYRESFLGEVENGFLSPDEFDAWEVAREDMSYWGD